MNRRNTQTIDMRLDGSFPTSRRPSMPQKIAGIALAVAVLAGALALLALLAWLVLWAVLVLVPMALLAGAVAWATYRFQAWKARRSFGGSRDLFRR